MVARRGLALMVALSATACARDNPAYLLEGTGADDTGAAMGTDAGDSGGDGDGATIAVDSGGEGSGGQDEGTDGGVVPVSCDGDSLCFVSPGGEWKGPYAFHPVTDFAMAEQCPDPSWPTWRRTGTKSAHDPTSCCQCALEVEAVCWATITGLSLLCGSAGIDLFEEPLDTCVAANALAPALSYSIATGTASEATCHNVAPPLLPVVDEAARLCSGDPVGMCEDGECYPLPEEGELCITHPGTVECVGPFVESHQIFDAVAADYVCATCECSVQTECVPQLHEYATGDCSGMSTAGSLDADCIPDLGILDEQSMQIVFDRPSCESPPDTAPAGEFTRENVVTVCCLP